MQAPKTSKDLCTAILDDERRRAIDDAKKRAFSQKVDYDTFRNMVLTAHLKPLQAPAAQKAGPLLPAWRLTPDGQQLKAAGPLSSASVATAGTLPPAVAECPKQQSPALPATAAEFERHWQRSCSTVAEHCAYLEAVGSARLRVLFRVEMGAALLGEVLAALQERWAAAADGPEQGDVARFALELLLALTECGRFSLAVRLLQRPHRAAAVRLFDGLEGALGSSTCESTGAGASDKACSGTGSGTCSGGQSGGECTEPRSFPKPAAAAAAAAAAAVAAAAATKRVAELRAAYGLR